MHIRTSLACIAIGAVLLVGAVACSPTTTGDAPAATLPPGAVAAPTLTAAQGQALLDERCTVCHGVSRVTRTVATPAQWDAIVGNMMQKGAQLTDSERALLVAYLAETYHP